MRNMIKGILLNKFYIGCLIIVFIQYVIRSNYIKQALFNTTSISSVSQYTLLILAIIGATILAGTIIFISFYFFVLVFKKFTLPMWKEMFNVLKK